MHRKPFKLVLYWMASAVLVAYLAAPWFAGFYGVGNRLGPKIYPEWWHETVYIFGWEASGDKEATKPRVGPGDSDRRPWFYDFSDRQSG